MTSCSNCNNVLPRTVDQCPVCGCAVEAVTDQASTESQLPGWAAGGHVTRPRSAEERATDPVPDALKGNDNPGNAEQSARPEKQSEKSTQRAPGPASPSLRSAPFPPIPGKPIPNPDVSSAYEAAAPRRVGHDGAHGGGSAGHAPLPELPSSVSVEPVASRSVTATSNRVDANVRLGPTKHHAAVGFGLLALALGSLFVGSVGAAALIDTDQKYVASTTRDAGNDAVLSSETLDAFAAEQRAKIVRLELDDCATASTTFGYRTAANELVSSRSRLVLDTSPEVIFTSGDAASSLVLGWATGQDFALLRLDQPSNEPVFEWGAAGRIGDGTELAVLTPRVADGSDVLRVDSTLVVVAGVNRNRATGVAETVEVASDQELIPQSVVLDTDGHLVGIVDNDGAVRAVESLRASISEARTAPVFPSSSCPAASSDPEPTE